MSAFEAIKASPLFRDLYDKELDVVLRSCLVVSFRKDEFIVKEGEDGTDLYVVLMGDVKVTKNAQGKDKELVRFTVGDVFGEMVLIDERTRTSNVIAITDCDILVISQDQIFDLYKGNTGVFSIIMLNIARMLTRRLKNMSHLLDKAS